MDVRDPTGTVDETRCSYQLLPDHKLKKMYLPPASDVVSGSISVVDEDLEVVRCWGPFGAAGSSDSLWMDDPGKQKTYELAVQAPSISLVVVLLNLDVSYGAGIWEVWQGSIGLAILGMVQVEDGFGGHKLADFAHLRFAHEVGHGLGLLDEYVKEIRTPLAVPDKRNIWHPQEAIPVAAGSAAADTLPWLEALERPSGIDPCTADQMVACCAVKDGSGGKEMCSLSVSSCVYVPAVCQAWDKVCESDLAELDIYGTGSPCKVPQSCPEADEAEQLTIDGGCNEYPGAWEGGNYARLKYYRAKWNCRMNETSYPFCEACAIVLRRELCSWGSSGLVCPGYAEILGSCLP
jgi:hypothetical protein